MAIGRISGSVLKSNLTRNGTDLAFETNLLYLDVTNSRIGIGISEPTQQLHVNGTTLTTALSVTGSSTLDGVTITDNTISTNASNSDLELSANGSGTVKISGINFPTTDGSNGQVIQTDGSGNLTFAESSGGGGGNNTAVTQFSFNKLTTTQTVVDEFDINEYRGAVYHVGINDITNSLIGTTTVNVVHNSTTSFISQYRTNEDSTNLVTFTTSISGTKVRLLASANAQSSHVNLKFYRIALGDHHTTVANTNSKIIVSSTSILSSATTIDQFTATDIRSAKYYILIKNGTNEDYQLSELSLVHDGSTVYINDYGKTSTNANQYPATFSADISGSSVNLKATAGGGVESTATMYRLDLGSTTKLGEYDNAVYGKVTDREIRTVEINSDTTFGTSVGIGTTSKVIDQFTKTDYDSAYYFAVTKNLTDDELGTAQISLVHDGTTAFVSSGGVVNTGASSDQLTYSASLSGSTVSLDATGTTASNSVSFYRINLGDNTAASSGAPTSKIINLDVDSAVENLDTWSASVYRGARYFISCSSDNGELSNIEAMVVHNGSDAFISSFNENFTGNNSLITLSADVSGGNVRLRASCNTNTVVKMYRIILGDSETATTGTYNNLLDSVTVSSGATAIDTIDTSNYVGAHYVVVGNNSSEGASSISDVYVVTDGSDAYVGSSSVSTKGTDQLTFTASLSNGTITLNAQSTSGSSTTVNAYRTHLDVPTGGDGVVTLDKFSTYAIRSATYFISIEGDSEYQNSEITLTNDGSDSYITEQVVRSGSSDLVTFTADVSSGEARLIMSGNTGNNTVRFARMYVEEPLMYRATNDSSNNLYANASNFTLSDSLASFAGATGALTLPNGTTAQRPTGANGMLRYNTSLSRYEKWDGSEFVDILATTTAAADTDNTSSPTPETGLGTAQSVIDQFSTSSFDSAYYYAVTRDEINNDVATERYTLVHNDSQAFVSSSNGVQSGSADHMSVDADISGGNVRLLATGASVVNSVSLFRIGLGDSTTASSSGNTATILNTDVDSAVENLDTWSATTYRGAKYFISVSAANGELSNLEAVVVTDGSDAYISIYNEIFTGNDSLLTLSADVSSGSVRLRASGNTPNCNVKMYRILLGDSETTATGDTIKTVGASSVSSSATSIDTFSTESVTGAQYVVVGYNSAEGAASISEVHVVTDGSDAYVSSGPIVSSKDSDQLTFTASLSGTTVTVSAASTSGGSTTVNAWRVSLLRTESGASTSEQVLITPEQTITGAKTFDSPIALTVGSDPATVADKAHIYAKDEAASAEVYVRDEAGNVTKISPHNAQGEWEYYSKNTRTGKTVRVNMEEMIRDIEKLTGKTYIKDE
jgi:hypothetical protein